MIDSGAEGLFINRKFVERHEFPTVPLHRPIPVKNIDGTNNQGGAITHTVALHLSARTHEEDLRFFVTDLGGDDLILGLPWLEKHNPPVDWNSGIQLGKRAETPSEDGDVPPLQRISASRRLRREWKKSNLVEDCTDEIYVGAGYTYSQAIAAKQDEGKRARTYEEIVPEYAREFDKVFSEEESHRLPARRPWDHAVELKVDAPETHKSKIYPMTAAEQIELDKFLEEQLAKGYIRPSKSPIASPVFFIKKKDGKLRLIQDYRWLNE